MLENQDQQTGNSFAGVRPSKDGHPHACGIQFVKRHFQKPSVDRQATPQDGIEILASKATKTDLRVGIDIEGVLFPPGPSEKVTRKQESEDRPATVRMVLPDYGDSAYDRSDILDGMASRGDFLTGPKRAVGLDLLQEFEFLPVAK